jgi:hypothetical protein
VGAAITAAPALIVVKASLRLNLKRARKRVPRLVHHRVHNLRTTTDQYRRHDPANQRRDQALEDVDPREPPQRTAGKSGERQVLTHIKSKK